ncbi:hypothetical protein SAZ11_26780 [Streptomyces sp. FXJ1.4098]|nr:hypothetical protein [Streptomyces sp. FXJ1.4098]
MSAGALVRAELERHDWAALRCGCGELDTLCHLVSGDSHATEQVLGRTRLGDECRLGPARATG